MIHGKGRSNGTRIILRNSSQLMDERPKISLPAPSLGSGFHLVITVCQGCLLHSSSYLWAQGTDPDVG